MKNTRAGRFAVLALSLTAAAAAQPAPSSQKTFSTPEEAVSALSAAVKVHDKAALRDIFGPDLRDLLTGDEKQDKANSRNFAAAMAEGASPVSEGDGKVIVEIGGNKWPFPIPLVKSDSGWRFDTAAGKEEIIDRHVGKDELHAIGVCEAYVRALKGDKDASIDDNHTGVVARELASAAGPRAGKAFHGYLFRVLAGQGVLTAFPEHWGRSGVMTFIAGRDGAIYQRDLGEKTAELAAGMTEFVPSADWMLVKDRGVSEK